MRKRYILPIVAAGLLAVSAFFGVKVLKTVQAAAGSPGAGEVVAAHLGAGYDDTYLAEALGISVDELTAAYESANQAALDQAVAEGLITQAQADTLAEAGAAFPFGGRWSGWLSQQGIDYDALLAEALGISVDELNQARLAAHSAAIDAAVADGSLTAEQADLMKGQFALRSSESFRSSIQSAYQQAVQQAVEDGVITQSQADAILEQLSTSDFGGMRGGLFGGMFGGRHGQGGRMGPGMFIMPGNDAAPDIELAPEVETSFFL